MGEGCVRRRHGRQPTTVLCTAGSRASGYSVLASYSEGRSRRGRAFRAGNVPRSSCHLFPPTAPVHGSISSPGVHHEKGNPTWSRVSYTPLDVDTASVREPVQTAYLAMLAFGFLPPTLCHASPAKHGKMVVGTQPFSSSCPPVLLSLVRHPLIAFHTARASQHPTRTQRTPPDRHRGSVHMMPRTPYKKLPSRGPSRRLPDYTGGHEAVYMALAIQPPRGLNSTKTRLELMPKHSIANPASSPPSSFDNGLTRDVGCLLRATRPLFYPARASDTDAATPSLRGKTRPL